MELHGFKKTIKTSDMPADAKVYPNGDRCFKREWVEKQPTYAYYEKTKTGYKFEKVCFRLRSADSYNYVKNEPGFVKGGKHKPTPKAKPAPKKATVKKAAPKKAHKKAPTQKPATTEAALMKRLDEMQERLDNAQRILTELGHNVK